MCRTTFDYDKKEYNGFDLYCYEDGVRVEEVQLRLRPGEYNMVLTYFADEDYQSYAEEMVYNRDAEGIPMMM